jgi:hypothetical protein
LFYNVINIKELELYKEMNKRRELSRKEEIAKRFQLLRPLSKLYNILIHLYSTTAFEKEFLKLARRLVPLNNCTR